MNLNYTLILASKSPRRQQLLKEAGFSFEVRTLDTDESFPEELPNIEIARYLAEKKAAAFSGSIKDKELIITSDTTVVIDDIILNKPENKEHAIQMLQMLSGRSHAVITGVCLSTVNKSISFEEITEVYFKELTTEEIVHYVDHFKPYDKAGAYGIQEWIGLIGITRIEGSYFNVVGLPVQRLYQEILNF
jgi:septum formation protein